MRTAALLCTLMVLSLGVVGHLDGAEGQGTQDVPLGECRSHYKVVVVGLERFCLKPWLSEKYCLDDGTKFAAHLVSGITYCVDHMANPPIKYKSLHDRQEPVSNNRAEETKQITKTPVKNLATDCTPDHDSILQYIIIGNGTENPVTDCPPHDVDDETQGTKGPVENPVAGADEQSLFQIENMIVLSVIVGVVIIIIILWKSKYDRDRAAYKKLMDSQSQPVRTYEPFGNWDHPHEREEVKNKTFVNAVLPKPEESKSELDMITFDIKECIIVPDTNVWIDYFKEKGRFKLRDDETTSEGMVPLLKKMSESKSLYLAPKVKSEMFGKIKNDAEEIAGTGRTDGGSPSKSEDFGGKMAQKCREEAEKLAVGWRNGMLPSSSVIDNEKYQTDGFFWDMFDKNSEWKRHVQNRYVERFEEKAGLKKPDPGRCTWRECRERLIGDISILTHARVLRDVNKKTRIIITQDKDFLLIDREILAKFKVWVLSPGAAKDRCL